MNSIHFSVLAAFITVTKLSSQTVTLDNGTASMNISLKGGVITEMSLNSMDLNPIHQYGHFLCFDRWGPSSPEDQALGIPFHGNASKVDWMLHEGPLQRENYYFAEMSCLLPVVQLGLDRKIYLDRNSSVFRVVEEITNHGDSSRFFNLVQHATIGSPFLDETTIVDTRVDSGYSQAADLPPAPADVITWPEAVVDGDTTDLRFLTVDHTWWQAVVTFSLDNHQEYGWVTAVNPSLQLLVGYIWPVEDYPWLNLWLNLQNNKPFARGLEFGTTGLHRTWPEVLAMDTIFGKKLYDEIGVDDTIIKSYYAYLSEIPADYKGVQSVTMAGDKIKVEEYGLDQARTITLDINGILSGIDTSDPLPYGQYVLLQNHPNPFQTETVIAYRLAYEGHVHLEVFSALGQSIRILVDEFQQAGKHRVAFNASGLPGGMYFYRITSGKLRQQGKMIFINR